MKTSSLKEALSFKGKVAMVTGGCQNFGLEISDGFAELGAAVVIASVTSLLGRDRSVYEGQPMRPNPVPYTASKAGVIGLVYDCAALLGRHNIRVNAISPGGFERGQPQPFIDAYSARTPLGRMGRDGHDLKGAAVFLCSDAAAYVTGHNFYVDGGFSRFK